MINSCNATKEINSFQFVAIPSPRDVYSRYGERISDQGEYSTDRDNLGIPSMVSSSSVIDQMVSAQNMLESSCPP